MASKQKQAIISVALLAGAAGISTLLYLQRPPAEISEPSYAAVTLDVAEVVKVNPRIQVQAQGTVTSGVFCVEGDVLRSWGSVEGTDDPLYTELAR